MIMLSRRALTLAAAGVALAACSSGTAEQGLTTTTTAGADRSALVQEARAALNQLRSQQPGVRQLENEAEAVLVFPSITQAGLGVGGLYGNGVMFQNGEPVGYYNIAGGSFGFQIGAQSFSQAYFFNTQEALETFRNIRGFELGVSANAVAADFGAGGEISSSTLQQPLVVATWGQSGLMAAAVIEGAKITEISPS